jgi:hypothetical protein
MDHPASQPLVVVPEFNEREQRVFQCACQMQELVRIRRKMVFSLTDDAVRGTSISLLARDISRIIKTFSTYSDESVRRRKIEASLTRARLHRHALCSSLQEDAQIQYQAQRIMGHFDILLRDIQRHNRSN